MFTNANDMYSINREIDRPHGLAKEILGSGTALYDQQKIMLYIEAGSEQNRMQ